MQRCAVKAYLSKQAVRNFGRLLPDPGTQLRDEVRITKSDNVKKGRPRLPKEWNRMLKHEETGVAGEG